MGNTHWAEYDSVLAASRDPARLERLHEVPLTQSQAVALLQWAAKQMPLTGSQELKVFFMGRRGRATRKSREGVIVKRLITLPKETAYRVVDNRRLLRVGLVLHEYAHHAVGLEAGHGEAFVKALDDLCEAAEAPQEARSAAAGAKIVHTTYTKRSKCFRCGVMTTRKHSGKPG